jgi:methyl-accepting chemotaxis protein
MTKFWQRLIKPNPRLSPDDQRRARLLTTMVLSLGIFIVCFTPVTQVGGFNPRTTAFLMAGFGFCIVSYITTKLGFINFGAIIFFLLLMSAVVSFIATTDDSLFITTLQSITPIMTIAVLAAGVILSPWFSFVVAGATALATAVVTVSRVRPDFKGLEDWAQAVMQLSVPIGLLFVLAGVAWLFESDIQTLLKQLRQQNHELEETNSQLARNRQEEQRISQEINVLSGQVSDAFATQTNGASNQLSAVVEVTATLEELSQTNEQIARAASQVAESARHTLEVAESGSVNIKQSLEATVLLTERVQNMAVSMSNLFEQARQIDSIIDLITEVTEETDLLALNATIEAAGAREYGRRFAAVASEVQRLASRSRDATEQVRSVITEVQEAIHSSAEISRVGLQEASQIVGGARKAEQTIEEMVNMVQRTTTLAQQISLAIQQQRSASTQVVETMHQISEVSQEVAVNSNLLLNALNQLNQSAEQLKSISITQEPQPSLV